MSHSHVAPPDDVRPAEGGWIPPLRIAIVEDDEGFREPLELTLQDKGFEVRSYCEAEELLVVLAADALHDRQLPDLVIADLALKPGRMQGQELIRDLARRRFPLHVLAISGVHGPETLADSILAGASDFFSKALDFRDLVRSCLRLAEIGRRRKVALSRRLAGSTATNSARRQRPVFLSYSGRDEQTADALRRVLEARGIQVWYSADLQVGDVFSREIQSALHESSALISVMSDDYVHSTYCKGEATQFLGRIYIDADRSLLFCPTVLRLSEVGRRSDFFQQVSRKFHVVRLDGHQFIDGLATLLRTIQDHLAASSVRQATHEDAGALPA